MRRLREAGKSPQNAGILRRHPTKFEPWRLGGGRTRARTWDPMIKSQWVPELPSGALPYLLSAAPVSHQKRPDPDAPNAIKCERKRSKINKARHFPAAHNGLVAGSSPAGPTNEIKDLLHSLRLCRMRGLDRFFTRLIQDTGISRHHHPDTSPKRDRILHNSVRNRHRVAARSCHRRR
jgi:hypothetical protein